MTFEDELRATLRAHESEAPTEVAPIPRADHGAAGRLPAQLRDGSPEESGDPAGEDVPTVAAAPGGPGHRGRLRRRLPVAAAAALVLAIAGTVTGAALTHGGGGGRLRRPRSRSRRRA